MATKPNPSQSSSHDPLTCELCHAEGIAAELEHARQHRPTDRPDAYCVDCPFSDRGDFLVYRGEWDALNADRAENRRLRADLARAVEVLEMAHKALVRVDVSPYTENVIEEFLDSLKERS